MEKIDNQVGQPDSRLIPSHLRQGNLPKELSEMIEYGYSIDRQGLPETLNAVADFFNEQNTANISPEQIVMAHGARSAATAAILFIKIKVRYSEPKVLLITPGYNLYKNQFNTLGFVINEVFIKPNLPDDEKISLIRGALTNDTIIMPITNPNNPTGEIYSINFLRGLIGILEDFPNLHIISDSVYDQIIRSNSAKPDNLFAIANASMQDRIFEVNSLAKSFAYPGNRAGWVIASPENAAIVQGIQDPIIGPVNSSAQQVVVAALKHTPILEPDYFYNVRRVYDERLKLVHDRLRQINGFEGQIPEGTFYYWADFSGIKVSASSIVEELSKRDIKLSFGAKFGAKDCIRINCGASIEELKRICEEIVSCCKRKGVKIEKNLGLGL